jgi:hypothetical protein
MAAAGIEVDQADLGHPMSGVDATVDRRFPTLHVSDIVTFVAQRRLSE